MPGSLKVLIIDPEAGRPCAGNCCRIEGLIRKLSTPSRVQIVPSLERGLFEVEPDLLFVRAPAQPALCKMISVVRSVWKSAAAIAAICDHPAHTTAELIESVQVGLDDFLCCPFSEIDFAARLGRVLLERGEATQAPPADLRKLRLDMMVGQSPAFLDAISRIPRIAASTATVLLGGETGVGKELFARAIHYNGSREARAFVPVNCSALPDHLFENELFGHVKGAYTDASSYETGLVNEADGGTLFLDEVDMLSPSAQAKLLRFLQDREYRPLGSSKRQVADARVIAATNADLRGLVAQRQFREDLFHRLNVLSLEVPPLRRRMTDVPVLARHFLARFALQYKRTPPRLSRGALRKILAYSWPGNVRELEGILHRAVVFCLTDTVEASDVELPGALARAGEGRRKDEVMEEFERGYLASLLAEHDGNISHAARACGKDRRTFQRLLRKHGIERRAFRTAGSSG